MEFVDFQSVRDVENFSSWGDVVLFRNTSLDKIFERPFLRRNIEKSGGAMINKILLENPMIVLKSFQQKIVSDYIGSTGDRNFYSIETFIPNSCDELVSMIEDKVLRFPFVEKPDFGAQGKGVRKIEKRKDIGSVDGKIFQNYIRNDGDFRVLCLGGKALGVIRRTARQGDFRNNVSQGGSVEVVEDGEVRDKVAGIALEIAAIFNLDFCGVDIIYDQEQKKYFFLEINTHPWWQGFQSRIDVDVADLIIQHCLCLYERKRSKGSYEAVRKYYQNNLPYLMDARFHYASRTYLYLGDKKSKKDLLRLKEEYIGNDPAATDAILAKTLTLRSSDPNERELRMPLFKKYGLLEPYTKILFKVLFADVIYGQDIRPAAARYLDRTKMLEMKAMLEKCPRDMAVLSTYAVNFLYGLENYFFKEKRSSNFLDPESYYDIALGAYSGKLQSKHNLRLYFLAHCILGESRFYSRKATRHRDTYGKMIRLAEEIISKNYFDVNLDNKFEFLVCAKILGYASGLEDVINSEAQNSLAPGANYLIDTLNKDVRLKNKAGFRSAEHRNVLYLMAFGKSPRFSAGKSIVADN